MFEWIVKYIPPSLLAAKPGIAYYNAAYAFGRLLSQVHRGLPADYPEKLAVYATEEKSYAKLGYRTMPLDELVKRASREEPADDLMWVRRNFGESPIFWAAKWGSLVQDLPVLPQAIHYLLGEGRTIEGIFRNMLTGEFVRVVLSHQRTIPASIRPMVYEEIYGDPAD